MILINAEKALILKKEQFTSRTDNYIQAKIDVYNLANNVIFSDINSFPKYAINANSPHYDIANRFIVWVDSIWAAVRSITTEPTEAEFVALLDNITL